MKMIAKYYKGVLSALLSLTLVGCATVDNHHDPIEPVNRGIYSFNKGVDVMMLKPAAHLYDIFIPDFVSHRVSNFYDNLAEITNIVNALLQGKFGQAGNDVGRLVVNTTFGLGGMHDVASEMGLEQHEEDFGQTLGVWGYDNSMYIVLPLLGPSNFRDTIGRVGDTFTDPRYYVNDRDWQIALYGVDIIDTRAGLLQYDDTLNRQVDEYAFVRDFYTQKRTSLINDGEVEALDEFEFVEEDLGL